MSDPRPIGVNQDAGAQALWPFVRPQPDRRAHALISDFFISLPAGYSPDVSVKLRSVAGLVSVSPGIIIDINAVSTALSLPSVTQYSDNQVAWEWYLADQTYVRLILQTGFESPDPRDEVGDLIEMTDGQIQPDAVYVAPGSVTSITVNGEVITSGSVELQEGYNVGFSSEPPITTTAAVNNPLDYLVTGDFTSEQDTAAGTLYITASPGDGEGLVPGCNETNQDLLTINNVGADANGNINIRGDGCTSVGNTTSSTGVGLSSFSEADGSLYMHNDCGPCADCDDAVRVFKGLERQNGLHMNLGTAIDLTRQAYEDSIILWEQRRRLVELQPIRVRVAAEPRCKAGWVVSFCNVTRCCMGDIKVHVYVVGASDTLTCESVRITDPLVCEKEIVPLEPQITYFESGLGFTITWANVPSETSVLIKGRSCLGTCVDDGGDLKVVAVLDWANVILYEEHTDGCYPEANILGRNEAKLSDEVQAELLLGVPDIDFSKVRTVVESEPVVLEADPDECGSCE